MVLAIFVQEIFDEYARYIEGLHKVLSLFVQDKFK